MRKYAIRDFFAVRVFALLWWYADWKARKNEKKLAKEAKRNG